jgi:ABC-type cobalt transport system, ATPase component
MTFALQTVNLYFRYPGKNENVLDGINLEIQKGKVIAIVGPSGCGKSTLCYCLCGIIPHVYQGRMNGEVLIEGIPSINMKLPEIATRLGIVFQDPETQLFSPTVEDEIAFGPENLCIEREDIGRRMDESISTVNMGKYRLFNPGNLSGGQKQLIALASVLSLNPETLILDEVMAQVDHDGRNMVMKAIEKLKSAGKTIVMVEHDLENLSIADRILLLKNGKISTFEGRL